MDAQSSYKRLDIFTFSKKLVLSCYALTQDLPVEEKSNLIFYIRNAALAAHLSISQGMFLQKGKAKKKFLQQAKNAYVVIDAAVDVLIELKLVTEEQTTEVFELTSACYQQTESLLKEN
ncbi:MAG TPA: four helix bundle protein [Flavisolibacter sp.]|jgi:four helix bundle protein|nr:four helix bundle protein [Flavisolibacter sp.]